MVGARYVRRNHFLWISRNFRNSKNWAFWDLEYVPIIAKYLFFKIRAKIVEMDVNPILPTSANTVSRACF